jgi:hypothetical protein
MKQNEIVKMPTGRFAVISEMTERQIHLNYEQAEDGQVSLRREVFERLWCTKKITHQGYKQSAGNGVQPKAGERVTAPNSPRRINKGKSNE